MTRLLPFATVLLVALFGLSTSAGAPTQPAPTQGPVTLRLLGVNDLHGHLEPPREGIGGAAWLKAGLDRATLPGRTIRVHAGDMVGASPLISSWFHDEPTIEAANRIGFDVGTVGNHEFDEGGAELMRLLRGGRRSGPEALMEDALGGRVNTSSPGFRGAQFPHLAANTLDRDGEPLLPPYLVVERAGVRVGFIGVTTPSTPRFLLPRHARRFRFTDTSDAVNRWVPALRRQGVEAIVVLAHEGAPTQDQEDVPSAHGPVVDEAREMSDEVDVIVAGHSHSNLNMTLPNVSRRGSKLIIEAGSYGVGFDLVDLRIDRSSGEVISASGTIEPTSHEGLPADQGVAALVESYARRVAPLAGLSLANAPNPLTREGGELGTLVAHAQRAFAGTDVAVVTATSLRSDIDAGPVTYAEISQALAYGHPVLRVEIAGRDLRRLLAQSGRGLHLSGMRSVAGQMLLADGRRLAPGDTYTLAASELLVTGDWLPVLRDAHRDARPTGSEVEALAWFLRQGNPARP